MLIVDKNCRFNLNIYYYRVNSEYIQPVAVFYSALMNARRVHD